MFAILDGDFTHISHLNAARSVADEMLQSSTRMLSILAWPGAAYPVKSVRFAILDEDFAHISAKTAHEAEAELDVAILDEDFAHVSKAHRTRWRCCDDRSCNPRRGFCAF